MKGKPGTTQGIKNALFICSHQRPHTFFINIKLCSTLLLHSLVITKMLVHFIIWTGRVVTNPQIKKLSLSLFSLSELSLTLPPFHAHIHTLNVCRVECFKLLQFQRLPHSHPRMSSEIPSYTDTHTCSRSLSQTFCPTEQYFLVSSKLKKVDS